MQQSFKGTKIQQPENKEEVCVTTDLADNKIAH